MTYSEAFTKMVEDVNKPAVSMKNVMTKGLADVVLDGRLDPIKGLPIIGHVGFHDIDWDDNKHRNDIDRLAQKAAMELDTVIAQLGTKKGFQLVSFEILSDERWWAWKWWMRKNLEDQYVMGDGICDNCLEKFDIVVNENDGLYHWHCPKCGSDSLYTVRILRIDRKGDEPKPHLQAWRIPKSDREMEFSNKHVTKYREMGIIGDIPYHNFKLVPSTGMLIDYETKVENIT